MTECNGSELVILHCLWPETQMEFPIRTRILDVEMGKDRQRREERRKRRKTEALLYLHQKLPTRGKYILFLGITPTVHLHRKKEKIKQSEKQRQIIRV